MKQYFKLFRSVSSVLQVIWLIIVLGFDIIPSSFSPIYIILSSLLALLYFTPLEAKLELVSNWSLIFDRLFNLASALLVIGVLFRLMSWPDVQIFGFGITLLLISIIMIFFPKVQEVYLPDMKRVLLRVVILLIAGFYTFL